MVLGKKKRRKKKKKKKKEKKKKKKKRLQNLVTVRRSRNVVQTLFNRQRRYATCVRTYVMNADL